MFETSLDRKVNKISVTQRKKETELIWTKFKLVYDVIKIAAKSLTEKPNGCRRERRKRLLNWTILKKSLLGGEDIRLGNKLVPLFEGGT